MTSTTTTGTTKVPWTEINAALGHVVLLLDLLVDRCGWTITHQLVPMASASQIGIRRPVRTLFGTINTHHPPLLQPPVFTNLYFEESSFSLFKGSALRQFNIGLGALLECLVEIAQSDKTIVLPHAICLPTGTTNLSSSSTSSSTAPDNNHHNNNNNKNTTTPPPPPNASTSTTTTMPTIGGVPMVFGETADFTRACKYLLTNVKWLVAYAVKHHLA